jgi:hypothetical protein
MSDEKTVEIHNEKASQDHRSEVFEFGGEENLPPPPKLTEEEERKLWRKIDLRLMPILALLYLLSFIDRGEHVALIIGRRTQILTIAC